MGAGGASLAEGLALTRSPSSRVTRTPLTVSPGEAGSQQNAGSLPTRPLIRAVSTNSPRSCTVARLVDVDDQGCKLLTNSSRSPVRHEPRSTAKARRSADVGGDRVRHLAIADVEVVVVAGVIARQALRNELRIVEPDVVDVAG
jgi:hypothetical protein